MKVTVKIGQITVEIDRPSFGDYQIVKVSNGQEVRTNIMKDTVIPMLQEATEKAIVLHNEYQKTQL